MRKLTAAAGFFVVLILVIPYLFVLIAMPNDTAQGRADIAAADRGSITSYLSETGEVVEIDFSEYLKGVVAAEMPASFGEEALKAQAVAARSYILRRAQGYVRDGTPQEHHGALTCNDPAHCKAFITQQQAKQRWDTNADAYWEKIAKSVDDTAGLVMTYQGELVNAVFHSTGSGRTENAIDVWGGDVPYLVSVSSPGDTLSPKFHSSVTMSIDEFKQAVRTARPSALWAETDPLVGEISRSEAGGIKQIVIGGETFGATEFRALFSLSSANAQINIEADTVTIAVTGNGHGVGMSQYGANYLANQGMGYADILKIYYTGIDITPYTPNDENGPLYSGSPLT